jgi:hypothetical protein
VLILGQDIIEMVVCANNNHNMRNGHKYHIGFNAMESSPLLMLECATLFAAPMGSLIETLVHL